MAVARQPRSGGSFVVPPEEGNNLDVVALIEDRFEDTLRISRRDPPETLLVQHGGQWALPVVQTRDHHPADVGPTRRAIREQLGIDAFVLTCRKVTVADGVAQRLLDVEALQVIGGGGDGSQRWTGGDGAAAGGGRRAGLDPPGLVDARKSLAGAAGPGRRLGHSLRGTNPDLGILMRSAGRNGPGRVVFQGAAARLR